MHKSIEDAGAHILNCCEETLYESKQTVYEYAGSLASLAGRHYYDRLDSEIPPRGLAYSPYPDLLRLSFYRAEFSEAQRVKYHARKENES